MTAKNICIKVYAAQPREGTETQALCHHSRIDYLGFMQLNPARGRKQRQYQRCETWQYRGLCSSTPRGDGNFCYIVQVAYVFKLQVYAAQPREGTETGPAINHSNSLPPMVYAAQPREGTETSPSTSNISRSISRVYAAQPREGTETTTIR